MNMQVHELFSQLLDVEPRERARYYAAHAVPDVVRQEVESLLGFDEGPPIRDVVQAAVGLAFAEPASNGETCGPFRLLRLIGRGGMGVVYLAERTDGEVRQQVAVKLLRAALDSPNARQRFLQERQILASLDHPNIARLIDAGHRGDGQPWLAMEYVDGKAIDEYSRGLIIRDRVSLMASVCEAIAAAHQNLVVHRDLKPGNILVDANGNPRVLDFGIAKLMDASEATATVELRLTPEYASPEQITGMPVTTATDIYSLGAVLARVLGDCERVDRDLVAIINKAQRAEPHERYSTADKLAEDLRAWLRQEPVEARRGEAWYRVRRRLRKYWLPAAAGAVAVAGLAAGLVAARLERDVAQQRFDEVRKLANEFFAVEKDIQPLPGSTAVRERIVKTSIGYLESLARTAGSDWRLKAEIAAGYRRAAESQGLTRGMNLGKPAEALSSLRKAAALMAEVRAAAPQDRSVLRQSIELLEMQTRLDYDAADVAAIRARIDEQRALMERYETGLANEAAEWTFLGKQYESLSVTAARQLGGREVPMAFARKSVECQRRAVALAPSFVARGSLANALQALSNLLRAVGDLTGAVEPTKESLRLLEQLAGENPDHYTTQLNAANVHASLGRLLGDPRGPSLGQVDASIDHLQQSLRIGRRLMVLDPAERQIRVNHGIAAWRLGDVLRDRSAGAALERYDEAIALLRPLDGKMFSRNVALAGALSESTFALRSMGRGAEVGARLKEAWAICEVYRGKRPEAFETCSEYPSRAQADLALASGRPEEAIALHRAWIDTLPRATRAADAREESFSAFVLAARYRLFEEALIHAGRKSEAREIEAELISLVKYWREKLGTRNDVSRVLGQEK